MKKMKIEKVLQRSLKSPAVVRMLFVGIFLVLVVLPPLAAEEQQVVDGAPASARGDRSPDGAPQNSPSEAIDLARRKIAADPSSEQAQVELGYLLLQKGSLKEAQKAFDDALSLNARYHEALTGKGIVLARRGARFWRGLLTVRR